MSKTKHKPKIKAVLLDLGKVLLDFNFEPAFKRLAKHTRHTAEEIEAYFLKSGLEVLFDGGKISSSQFYREVRKALGLRLGYPAFKKIWNDIFTPNPPMIRLLRRLRPHTRLVLVSNTNAMHYEYLRGKYPMLKHFDRHVLSFKEKARKPDPRIYEAARRACRAKPQEIFYVDDREDLTSAAEELGFHTFTFRKNFRLLSREIRKIGILDKP